jgi:hypothetical protein
METIQQAVDLVAATPGGIDDDAGALAIIEVLNATLEIKKWEAEEGDATECSCRQCLATVALAQAIIEDKELWQS